MFIPMFSSNTFSTHYCVVEDCCRLHHACSDKDLVLQDHTCTHFRSYSSKYCYNNNIVHISLYGFGQIINQSINHI